MNTCQTFRDIGSRSPVVQPSVRNGADERAPLVERITEIVESMPLSASQIRSVRDRLEKTSLSVLREIWANRHEWHDAIMRGAM